MQTRMEPGGQSSNDISDRLTHTLLALLKCAREAVQAVDEQQLLQSVCDIFVEDGGFRMAWVGQAEPDVQKTIRPVAQAGSQDGFAQNTVRLYHCNSIRPKVVGSGGVGFASNNRRRRR